MAPSLISLVPIGNSKTGTMNDHTSDIDIYMENEYYNIDLEFTVEETEENFNKVNLFITSKFTSYKPNESSLVFHRMGSI